MKTALLTKEHLPEILKLYKDNFSDGWNKVMLESAFDTGRFIALGIIESDKLIGLITSSLTVDDADIEGVVVDKEYRKKGYAKALLIELEKLLVEKGIRKVFLEVRESNFPAISLYEKNGYTKINLRKKYYSDGENAVIMAKGKL